MTIITLKYALWMPAHIVWPLYVTLHKKTKHNAQGIILRYMPKLLPKVLIIDFHFWHRLIEESFLYTKICFEASRMLYLQSYGSKKSAV